jgi:hypothetical protein
LLVQHYFAQTILDYFLPHLIIVYIIFQGINHLATFTLQMLIYSHISYIYNTQKKRMNQGLTLFILCFLETIFPFSIKFYPSPPH